MQRLRLWPLIALGATGILAGIPFAAGAAAAAGTNSLTLNPNMGRPAASFSAEYRFFPPTLTCPGVQFTWDGRPLKTDTPPHRLKLTDPCVAEVAAVPLADDQTPGPHLVGAGTLRVAYTIVPAPTSSPTPLTTPPPPTMPSPSRTAGSTHQATTDAAGPGDDTAGGAVTSEAAVASPDTGAPSVAGESSGGGSGGGLVAWILIFGSLLILGGIAIFGVLIYRTHRGGRADIEADTQLIPPV
jgi:hypothetical protein